jgi:hypothetical protein
MVLDDGVCQREELPCLLVDFLSIPGTTVRAGHHRSPIAVRRHLLSRETGFETARSFFWHVRPRPPVTPSRRLSVEVDSLGKLRNRNAVNRQKPLQESIFLPNANIFLLWSLEWKGF